MPQQVCYESKQSGPSRRAEVSLKVERQLQTPGGSSSGPLTVTLVRNIEALQAIQAQWDRLVTTSPFLQPLWLANWWELARPSGELFVLTVRNADDELCGLLPLYRQRDLYSGVTLRSMGDTGACTDYFSLITATSNPTEVASALANFLADQATDFEFGWDRMILDGVAGNDGAIAALSRELEARGASTHACSRMNLWRLPTAGTVDQWFSGFSRSSRTDLRRRARIVASSNQIVRRQPNTQMEVYRDTQTVIDLHQQRWQASGQPGSFAAPQSREFIQRANAAAFAQGQLHLRILEWEGQPASGEIGYIGRDQVLYLYCVGRAPALEAKSVGALGNLATQLEAFNSDLQGVDYLRGDETYKTRCHAKPTPCLSVRIAAPTWQSRLRHAAWLTQFEMCQLIRRGVGRCPWHRQSLCQ